MDICEYLELLPCEGGKKNPKTWNYWVKAMLISKTLVHSPTLFSVVWGGVSGSLIPVSCNEHFL